MIDGKFGLGLFARTDSLQMEQPRRCPHALPSTIAAKLLPVATSHFSHMLDATQTITFRVVPGNMIPGTSTCSTGRAEPLLHTATNHTAAL